MADYTIQIAGWWTDTEEFDELYVYDLIENNTPAPDTAVYKEYQITSSDTDFREYSCKWDALEFTVRIEVV